MYDYQTERPWLFTEEGQVKFLEVRDAVSNHLKKSGAVRMDKVLGSGSTWQSIACVDRLVELKEIIEVTKPDTMGQYRIFTMAYAKEFSS